jgi:hypothetical protein
MEVALLGSFVKDEVERVNGEHEEEWGEGVSLTQLPPMLNRVTGKAIEEHP